MMHFKLKRILVDRETYILNAAKGKSVLHLGCADYPFTAERIANGSWLHSKITEIAKVCVGLELNNEIVKLLQENYGISNIIQGDAEKLDMLAPNKYDVIVAGEIIEHLNNPGLFLSTAKRLLSSDGILVISTANAFCLRRLLRIPFGTESVHPDHVYYFSHATLKSLVTRFGYAQVCAASYRLPNRTPLMPYIAERFASWLSPNLCEGIIHTYSVGS